MAPSARPGRSRSLARGKMLGKYRIGAQLGEGGFAVVYKARDTVEGIDVALKVPRAQMLAGGSLDDLLKEVRITGRLEHPGILPIKNATFVEQQLVIAYPLGEKSLADRLRHRIASRTALDYGQQLLEAVAYAHSRRVIHCDINPNNVILFPDGTARLTDFGIARIALQTRMIHGSGTGTVGYIAPEQALGQPSFRSDVFSLGLIFFRLFSGVLPCWPYVWPMAGSAKLRRKLRPEMIEFIRRAIEVNERRRFRNAIPMLSAFEKVRKRALRT
ncbi:MAG: serine/threonine protein kinase [Myxococcales bacterium]|nr:serine/threonine protein kinase [Myxococcales bacterium]